MTAKLTLEHLLNLLPGVMQQSVEALSAGPLEVLAQRVRARRRADDPSRLRGGRAGLHRTGRGPLLRRRPGAERAFFKAYL